MSANPALWLVIFILLAIPIAFSLIPNTVAGLLAGYFLGWVGFPGMVLSFSLASVLGYFLGKKLDSGFRKVVFDIWPKSRQTFEGLKRESIWTVVLLRLAPAPPFAVASLLLAWINCSLSSFLAGSIAGMLPRMALVVWLGSQSAQILEIIRNPSQSVELKWGSLLFLMIALLGFYWLGKKVKKKSNRLD